MDTAQPRPVSIIEPIGAAIEKTKEILFQPFDIGKWFAIGFCAWLATLGDGGGGGNGNFNFNVGDQSSGSCGDVQHEIHNLKEAVIANLPLIITVGCVIFLIIVVVSLVFMWLKSRGQFMFLHCVATNKGEVVWPWKQYAQQGNSLFLFRAVLGIIGAFLSLLLIVPLIFIFLSFAESNFEVFAATGVVWTIFIVLGLILMGIVFGVIGTLVKDFVVPVMYLNHCTVTEGFKRFWALCRPNLGTFFLFLLFLIIVNIVLGVIALIVVLAACCMCCVGIIFMIPYIGTVAMLPLLVWRRAYSAIFLSQFGPEYNVFAAYAQNAAIAAAEVPPVQPMPPTMEGGDLPPQPPEQNF